MKPSGDICPDCNHAFECYTRRGECMSTGLCHSCCIESDERCVDICGQLIADIADDDAHDAAYDRETAA